MYLSKFIVYIFSTLVLVSHMRCTQSQVSHHSPTNQTIGESPPQIRPARITDPDDEFHFLVTGGFRPEHNDYVKYVVSLRTSKQLKFFGDNHFCGGSIIAKKVVLTAAHCLYVRGKKVNAKKIQVIAGTPRRLVKTDDTQIRAAKIVKPHPRFDAKRLTNDVGLVIVNKAFTLDMTHVAAISLPKTDAEAGTQCIVCGWGTILQFGPMPDEALNANLSINSHSFCSKLEGFRKGMICASNKNNYEVDSCQGDSGGPLICNSAVVGIVSFGIGCGEPNSAGIYTNVYQFRKWIQKNSYATRRAKLSTSLFIGIIGFAIYTFF